MAVSTNIELLITAENQASGALSQIKRDVDDVNSRMSSLAKKGMSELRNAGETITKAVLVAGASLVYFGKTAVDSYREAENATATLTALILNQKGATQENVEVLLKQAKALSTTTTVSDTAIVSAQKMLATFDFGSETIKKVIPAFLDMAIAEKGASINAEELAQMANGMGKAMQGNTELFSKMGFEISKSQKEVLKFGSEAERLDMIIEILGGTYEGVAEKIAKTFGGQLEIAKNNIGSFQESIGQLISVAMFPLIQRFNEWFIAVGGAEGVIEILRGKLAFLQEKIKELLVYIRPAIDMFIAWAKEGTNLKDLLIGVFTAMGIAVGVFVVSFLAAKATIIGIFALITAGVVFMRKAWENDWGGIQGKTNAVIEFLKDLFFNHLKPTFDFVVQRLQNLKLMWDSNFGGIRTTSREVWEQIKTLIKSAFLIIDSIFKLHLALFRGDWSTAWNEIKNIASNIWNAIKSIIILAFLLIEKQAKDFFSATFKIFTEGFGMVIESAEKFAKTIKEAILGGITSISKGVKETFDDIVGWANKAIEKIKSVKDSKNSAGKGVDKLALGGPVRGGQSYVVGERGPEMFVPSQSGNIKPQATNKSVVINVNNPSVREDMDINRIVNSIRRQIANDQSLAKLGI
jgi:hypothetical protein